MSSVTEQIANLGVGNLTAQLQAQLQAQRQMLLDQQNAAEGKTFAYAQKMIGMGAVQIAQKMKSKAFLSGKKRGRGKGPNKTIILYQTSPGINSNNVNPNTNGINIINSLNNNKKQKLLDERQERRMTRKKDNIRGPWGLKEDALLAEQVLKLGPDHVKWSVVASNIPGRRGKQCRERWCNNLDPTLNHSRFTSEEDKTLYNLQKVLGNKWKFISKKMIGRSENAIKNRFCSSYYKLYIDYLFKQHKEGVEGVFEPYTLLDTEGEEDPSKLRFVLKTSLGDLSELIKSSKYRNIKKVPIFINPNEHHPHVEYSVEKNGGNDDYGTYRNGVRLGGSFESSSSSSSSTDSREVESGGNENDVSQKEIILLNDGSSSSKGNASKFEHINNVPGTAL